VPCDTGGLPACIYLRSHGYSPGERAHADDLRAWDVYWKMQRVGFEAVYRLGHLDQLGDYAAEWLLTRLVLLEDAMRQRTQAMQAER
jgi:hypothetical protein